MPTVTIPTREVKPFYEQERESLPERLSGVVTTNNIRVGAGTDIFSMRGEGLVVRSSLSESTVSGFDNGEQLINQVKVTNLNKGGGAGRRLIAIVERAIYVDNDGVTADLLPGGSNIDESDYQIIAGNPAIIDTDGSAVEEHEVVNQLYIRNISAGTVTLYIDVYVRYILNLGGASSSFAQ